MYFKFSFFLLIPNILFDCDILLYFHLVNLCPGTVHQFLFLTQATPTINILVALPFLPLSVHFYICRLRFVTFTYLSSYPPSNLWLDYIHFVYLDQTIKWVFAFIFVHWDCIYFIYLGKTLCAHFLLPAHIHYPHSEGELISQPLSRGPLALLCHTRDSYFRSSLI